MELTGKPIDTTLAKAIDKIAESPRRKKEANRHRDNNTTRDYTRIQITRE